MSSGIFSFVLSLVFVSIATPAWGQAPVQPAGPVQEVVAGWNEIGRKLIAMAEDFPEDKYDYRPKPEVRTFAEQLLHVAGSNFWFLRIAKGEPPGEEDLQREEYKTKADAVAALKKSFADGAAYIEQQGEAGLARTFTFPGGRRVRSHRFLWTEAIEHSGEHYGQLVFYFRLNGIVPPESRPRSQ